MPVPPLDLKAIWETGKAYPEWLKACEPAKREEMEKIYASVEPAEEAVRFLRAMRRPVHVLAIAEAWCGDVRRNLPVLVRLCAESPHLRLRVVDKESRPELMVRYLTNGAEAIPVFVFFSENFVEVGNWGPRPQACKRFMARGKAAGNMDAARLAIKDFYANDAHRSTVAELRELIETASVEEV